MAKKASTGAKSATKTQTKTRTKAVSRTSGAKSKSSGGNEDGFASNAADALLKLLESPLVADLLAVGATAALAALTEHRYGSRTGKAGGAKRALKGAVAAAAGAMGRRIATEFEEIKKSAKAKSGEAA